MKKISTENIEYIDDDSVCNKFWYPNDIKRKILFKGRFEQFYKGRFEQFYSDIGEVFVFYLLKKLGVNKFVEYKFVESDKGDKGTLCKNFIKNNEILFEGFNILEENFCFENNININVSDKSVIGDKVREELKFKNSEGQYLYNVEYLYTEINKFCKRNNYKVDMEKLKSELNVLFIIDYFTCQGDRHYGNIGFLADVKKKTFEMSPIYDNGLAFGLDYPPELSKLACIRLRFGYSDIGSSSKSLKESRYFKNGGIFASDILDIIKTDKNANELFKKFMKLDIEAEIDEFEEIYGIQIPAEHKSNMIEFAKKRVDNIYAFVEKMNKRLRYRAKALEIDLS